MPAPVPPHELIDTAVVALAGLFGAVAGIVIATRSGPTAGLLTGAGIAAVVLAVRAGAAVALAPSTGNTDPADPSEGTEPPLDPSAPGSVSALVGQACDATTRIRQLALTITDPLQIDAADDLVTVASRVVDSAYRSAAAIARGAGDEPGATRTSIPALEAAIEALEDVADRLASPSRPSLLTLIDDLRAVCEHLAVTAPGTAAR
jgi:hypothetical protein